MRHSLAEPRPGPEEPVATDHHQHDQEQAEPEGPVLRRPGRQQRRAAA